jgi:predicted  nucleic acid-binding Zn-ribbon protein
MTELITSIIGVAGIAIGGTITWATTRRNNLTTAYQHLVEAQGELKKQIDAQDEKIDKLIQTRDELQHVSDLETGYIRSLGHWMASLCEVLDDEFLTHHPKPPLPDELRDRIRPL